MQQNHKRTILASSTTASVLVTGILIAAISSYFYNDHPNSLQTIYRSLQQNPWSQSLHMQLAREYALAYEPVAAEEEVRVALELPKDLTSEVAQENLKTVQTILGEIENRETDLVNRRNFWEEQARKYPRYKDAWVQLLLLATMQQDGKSIEIFKEKVRELDPNYDFEKKN